jgi:hypothetical protein
MPVLQFGVFAIRRKRAAREKRSSNGDMKWRRPRRCSKISLKRNLFALSKPGCQLNYLAKT